MVLDALPIQDAGHLALLGLDFAGAGDRRAVDAQAAHAAGGPTGRETGRRVAVAAAARPGASALPRR